MNSVLVILTIASIIWHQTESEMRNLMEFNSYFSKNGSFQSPGYPYSSSTERHRKFEFKGRPEERVQIIFDDFQLYRKNPNNRNKNKCGLSDSYLSYKKEDDILMNICGNEKPLPIMSDTNLFTLEYTQSEFIVDERQGFNATYKFTSSFGIDTGEHLGNGGCEFVYNSDVKKNGTFYSPNFNGYYPKDTRCSYTFIGNENFLRLNFTQFNLLGPNICKKAYRADIVELSATADMDESIYYKPLCGSIEPFVEIVNGSHFFVFFQSYDDREKDATAIEHPFVGFYATYEFINNTSANAGRTVMSRSAAGLVLFYAVITTSYIF